MTDDGASHVVRVLAAVISREGRYLVCQRPAHKRHGGLWEFPGGKLEAGEDDVTAAHRELHEELGVRVTEVGAPRYVVRDDGSPFDIVFVPVAIAGEPRCLEHAALTWATADELLALPLAPSDRRFVVDVLMADEKGETEAQTRGVREGDSTAHHRLAR